MKNYLVSCILTTFNRCHLLKRSLDSIINQTYRNLEILVIDDCSSDNTKKIIKSYDDKRIKYIRHLSNKGLAQSRNTGIENSSGEYFAFLDDDDEWFPNKIKQQLKIFQYSDLKNLGMVMCGIRRINGKSYIDQKEVLRGNLLSKMLIDQPLVGNGSCALIKKEIYKKYGGFDARYKRGIDGYYFRKIATYYAIDYCDRVLVNYYEDTTNRITDFHNLDKVRDALNSEFLKFEERKKIIESNSKLETKINIRIAEYYILLNEYKNVMKYFFKGFKNYLGVKRYILFLFYFIIPNFVSNKLKEKRMYKLN